MKAISTLLVTAALLLLPTVKGQQTTQPQQPAVALPPCEAPKQPGVWDRVKQRAKQQLERTIETQARKGDVKIAKNTNGGVDSGLGDTAAAAANAANQPKPCTPVKPIPPVSRTAAPSGPNPAAPAPVCVTTPAQAGEPPRTVCGAAAPATPISSPAKQ